MMPVPEIVCRCLPMQARESKVLLLGGLRRSSLNGLVGAFEISYLIEELVVLILGDDVARTVEDSSHFDTQFGSLEIS